MLAREYGFANWRELKAAASSTIAADALPPSSNSSEPFSDGDADVAARVLAAARGSAAAINEPIFGLRLAGARGRLGNNVEMVDVLLEFGADPNRKSELVGRRLPSAARRARRRRPSVCSPAGAFPTRARRRNLDRADLLAADDRRGPGARSRARRRRARRRCISRDRDASSTSCSTRAPIIDARDIDHRSTAAEWMLGDEPDDARPELAKYLVERGASADIFLAAALGLTDRARAMLQADPALLALRTGQGEYGEKRPSSFHIYQWTIGPNLSPLQAAAKFEQHETLRGHGAVRVARAATPAGVPSRRRRTRRAPSSARIPGSWSARTPRTGER